MGTKIENVKKNVEQATQLEQKGIEQGERDAEEVKEIKAILEGMDSDVDEDILQAIEATKEAAKSEGADHMREEAGSTLEEGYKKAGEAMEEGRQQSEKSHQAAENFASVHEGSEFGSSTAEKAEANAEGMSAQFEEYAESAQEGAEESQDRYEELMADLLG